MSVLLPCCPALLYFLLRILNCFVEQINDDDDDDEYSSSKKLLYSNLEWSTRVSWHSPNGDITLYYILFDSLFVYICITGNKVLSC